MWLCEGKLKVKTAHFRLSSASQKRSCLSSLIRPFVPYHSDNPNSRNGARLRSPSPIVASVATVHSIPSLEVVKIRGLSRVYRWTGQSTKGSIVL